MNVTLYKIWNIMIKKKTIRGIERNNEMDVNRLKRNSMHATRIARVRESGQL